MGCGFCRFGLGVGFAGFLAPHQAALDFDRTVLVETDDCAAGGVGLGGPNFRRCQLVDLLLQGVELRVGFLVSVVAIVKC